MTALPAGRLFIGGDWTQGSTDASITTVNPTTAETLAELPSASTLDVDEAVGAARKGFEVWRATPPVKRRDFLLRLAALVTADAERIATLEATDVGMPVSVARRISARAMQRNLEYGAGWAERLYGDVVPLGDDSFDYTLREPLGVVAAIIPWNTPGLFCGGKVGMALACGNAIVLKPSPLGSLVPLRFAELVAEAGLPPGVVNVITGGGDTGRALVEHPGVDGVTFTGSTRTGREVMAMAARGPKHVHLELGGKSPNIVFADADLERAAGAAALGCFALSGQACAAGSRLVVSEEIAEEFVARVTSACQSLTVGDPLEPSTALGPLISAEAHERVLGYVETGKAEGASVLTGGKRAGDRGFFVEPTIFTGCTNDMTICREEIFGPVLSVLTVRDEEEAIAIANDTTYGLAAGVWTKDLDRAHRVARRLEAGTVWINAYGSIPAGAPFGGYKASGLGRESGREAADEYTQVKNVYVSLRPR
jgi:acyl-CoA reductase-like NAD-dependent aldehyde dehydrogenase